MSKPNSCLRCNAGMPSFRVNELCEECFAEEFDDFDSEIDDEREEAEWLTEPTA